MPRRQLVYTNACPYHVTARVNNREPFPGDFAYAWQALSAELYLQGVLYGTQVHAFVLMPNHFHLLVSSPKLTISQSMQRFLSSGTRLINTRSQRWGRVFGSRYFWSVIDNPLYYAHVLKYVYRNPVKAGICSEVQEYEYSTFAGLVGRGRLTIPVTPAPPALHKLVPGGQCLWQLQDWLNEPHGAEENERIGRGLRQERFELSADRNTRRPRPLTHPLHQMVPDTNRRRSS